LTPSQVILSETGTIKAKACYHGSGGYFLGISLISVTFPPKIHGFNSSNICEENVTEISEMPKKYGNWSC